jgi:hypothetical protein
LTKGSVPTLVDVDGDGGVAIGFGLLTRDGLTTTTPLDVLEALVDAELLVVVLTTRDGALGG